MSNHSENYVFYWNGPFSQWQPCEIVMDEVTFNTAEQAMMHFKALLFEDTEIAEQIKLAKEPGKQKALGRKVRGFEEAIWVEKRESIVLDINRAKFRQNKGLRRKLFQTGTKQLVEASPLDAIWGIGLDAEAARQTLPEHWPGKNLLGKIVTQVREELRGEFPKEAESVAVSDA